MTNNNSNNNSKISWKEIVLMILSLIGTMVIVNWIADKVSTWLADLFFPEEKEEDQKIKVETKIEEVDEDEVPERIKTIINGKITDQVDQFIIDCKELKRSKIGSHRTSLKMEKAKEIKRTLTKMEQTAPEYFDQQGFNRQTALSFTDEYFTLVNEYMDIFCDSIFDKVSFEETDAIVDKYFGEA